ncbi:AEC family transporter [Desulfoscipio geothermicus]|nr:AEC family transporter [Desulfoscipio geothermicus]
MANILLPILLCISVGVISGRVLRLEVKTLSQLVLYILGPCLTFSLLIKVQLTSSETWQIISFTVLHFVLGIAIMAVVLYLTCYAREIKTSAILSAVFMNSANYGLPVVLFAFGEAGVERAIIFVVMQLVLFNTLGVFWGAQAAASWLKAFKKIVYLPTIFAVALAIILRVTGWHLPKSLISTADLLGQGAIPVMLVLLGAQLAGKKELNFINLVFGVTFFRLIISPFLAFLILYFLFKTQDAITCKVLLVESAMPTAVNNILLAIEFKGEPDVVSNIILVTTIFSFITLSVLIKILLS